MDGLRPLHRVLIQAIAGSAPNLFVCGADIKHLVIYWRYHPKHLVNVLRKLSKLLLARLQCLFSLLTSVMSGLITHVPQKITIRRRRGSHKRPPSATRHRHAGPAIQRETTYAVQWRFRSCGNSSMHRPGGISEIHL